MPAKRRLTMALVVALTLSALATTSALAQMGTPNPSGGTRLTPSTQEGSGSISLSRYLSRGLSIELGLRAWIHSYLATRLVVPIVGRPLLGGTAAASTPRRVWAF